MAIASEYHLAVDEVQRLRGEMGELDLEASGLRKRLNEIYDRQSELRKELPRAEGHVVDLALMERVAATS